MLNKKYSVKKYIQNLIIANAYMDEMLNELNEIVIEENEDSSFSSSSKS